MSVVVFVFVVFVRLGVIVFLFVGFVSLAWTWDEMLHKCSWISHFLSNGHFVLVSAEFIWFRGVNC
jgi:hypothetical protein